MSHDKSDDKMRNLVKQLVDHFDQEDKAVRERQIRMWRKLKLMWDGFHRTYYSEVAHDWRIYDYQENGSSSDQSSYDKPINVFRAYLESIIAALSVVIPPVKCYPDDADNSLDLATAKAGDKIAELIYKHNDVSLLWLHALFIYCTEGMVACYTYTKEDEKYGTYETPEYKENTVTDNECPHCKSVHPDVSDTPIGICPECGNEYDSTLVNKTSRIEKELVGVTKNPKSRQAMEVYGGLYVKIPNYAKTQADCSYLFLDYETHYSNARSTFPEIREEIGPGLGSGYEPYGRWGRLSSQYNGEYPINNVTIRHAWFRPSAYEIFETEERDLLLKKYPKGVKVDLVNNIIACDCTAEELDEHWTLTHNPLSDFLNHDPLGLLLTSVQEITNDIISLTVQTIEHGISQTFADPNVLNFDQYGQTETAPGSIYPITPKAGKSLNESFFELRTANLSAEVMPFSAQIQSMGQLVSGAQPSLFGGSMEGTKTASEYSMSRAQSLQRLQTTWKMFTIWWKTIFSKVVPAYIGEMQEDEKFVELDKAGKFFNTFIRRAELEGKIGNIELEANENLPITFSQRKDLIMNLLQSSNPEIIQMLTHPENTHFLYEAIGLDGLVIPGEEDRVKQWEEIDLLQQSQPIPTPVNPEEIQMLAEQGQPPPPDEMPSIEVDQLMDNHMIQFEICRLWAISDSGRLAKQENPEGYKNVLLHAQQHFQLIPVPTDVGAASGEAPKEKTNPAPDTGVIKNG